MNRIRGYSGSYFKQTFVRFEVRESLREVYGLMLARQLRHYGKNTRHVTNVANSGQPLEDRRSVLFDHLEGEWNSVRIASFKGENALWQVGHIGIVAIHRQSDCLSIDAKRRNFGQRP